MHIFRNKPLVLAIATFFLALALMTVYIARKKMKTIYEVVLVTPVPLGGTITARFYTKVKPYEVRKGRWHIQDFKTGKQGEVDGNLTFKPLE